MSASLANLSDSILSWVLIYGPLVLAIVFFLGALGIPVPGTFLVFAGGAFVRQEVLSLYPTLAISLVGVVLGDVISYSMGRFARNYILYRFANSKLWRKAEENFAQWGGAAVYLTRCLLTPIAVPTNLIAGSGSYPFTRFVTYDVAGELTWFLVYGGIGYFFSSQWEALSAIISNFSGVLVGVALLGVGVFIIWRWPSREKAAVAENGGLTEIGD